ncbi:MAG TPA: hypothetical protein VNQ73_22440 [Ilumatobacter sp.]|nr:hypothetical protein [Ilumatobacter sp.]
MSDVPRFVPRARTLGRLVVTGALLAGAVAIGSSFSGGGRVIAAVGDLGAGGEYHPLTPVRILDTREPELDVSPAGRKPMSKKDGTTTFDVQVAGVGGLPEFADEDGDGADDNVLAVAVNVTVVAPTQTGYLRAFGKGAPEGDTSVVNFGPGEVVPNAAILRPGAEGKLTIRLVAPIADGQADVLIDLFGWFSSSNVAESGSRVIPVGPGRVYDSREADFGGQPIAGERQVQIPIHGAKSYDPTLDPIVPGNDTAIDGVLVNLTAVNAVEGSQATHVSILPVAVAPGDKPTTSNLNLAVGQTRAVMAIVPVGPDGSIYLYNRAGATDLIVDVVGYLRPADDPTSRAGRVVPLVAPYRALDTRDPAHGNTPLGPGMAETWSFADFAADVKIGDDPVGPQVGLLGNLTATGLTRQYPTQFTTSYLTAYPPAGEVPKVSNLNISEGQDIPNLALLSYGAESGNERCTQATCVRFFNRAGSLHYLLDVSAVILA